jgi:hypothetical protein
VSQGSTDSLDAARAAVAAACAEAEGLLARARALREASEALRVRFECVGAVWSGSPERHSYEKAVRPVAERLYDLAGDLFRLCHAQGCTAFDPLTCTTRPVNAIGEQAMAMRRDIVAAGFGEEPAPWDDRHPEVAAADAAGRLPAPLRDLPSVQWATEQGTPQRIRARHTRRLVAGAFVLLGAAGASVSGILSHAEGGAGLLFGLALAGGAGWATGGLLVAVWRRLRRYRLMHRPSMRLLARFQRSVP